ncbi:ArsR/SmtB family transcription factor [Microlunatus parietis]|uniref:DNA-binding transcriptional ArsR family regulator n=1 Tax=Microlunatus parietis TaxID=682979 RepID=A0A7Y9I3R9_9ACTN|nr:metalloregulator ArsR/SmtB family transcription factor [Microlunatus parietis]NYE69430.1 DNA-binding transcriptional ArsR family regulator [Microlunatus parietis]
MRDGSPGDVRQVHDARALAALGHADRWRIIDRLAVSGTATTGELADALGLATGSISHHLRVLAEAGLVERAPDGDDRRQRSWRLVSRGLRWSPAQFRDSAAEAVATAADGALLARQFESARAFLASAEEPWDEAAYGSHVWLRLTPAELVELGAELDELLLRWRRRELPDDGAERTTVLAFARAFPTDP